MNPRAPIKKVHFGDAPIAEVLDIRGFNLNAILELDPEFLTSIAHEHHDESSRSCSSRTSRSTAPSWRTSSPGMIQYYGPDLLRYKGILWMKGKKERVVFQGVHMMMGGDMGKPWGKNEKKSSLLVFIGKKLPKDLFIAAWRNV
jgi:G3E family GTPase